MPLAYQYDQRLMGAAVASGRQTDLVVIDPMDIFNTRAVMTVFDGQVVYQA